MLPALPPWRHLTSPRASAIGPLHDSPTFNGQKEGCGGCAARHIIYGWGRNGPFVNTRDDLTIQEGVSRIATDTLPSIRGQIGGWEGTCSLLKTADL
jgi:hypothetical protein